MMMMNEVVDGWKRQRVGSNQIGTEERDRVDIDKQARLTRNRCAQCIESCPNGLILMFSSLQAGCVVVNNFIN